jgi:hypothetical protein
MRKLIGELFNMALISWEKALPPVPQEYPNTPVGFYQLIAALQAFSDAFAAFNDKSLPKQ